MEHNSQMQTILKRAALIGGGAVLLFSIFFSYDGFDQSMTGSNDGYSGMAIVLGFGLAIVFTIVEFIFNSGFGKLNLTLIVCGILAYVYSITMNYRGITHLLHMDDPFSAWVLASAMDILPESMFAWALGDSLKGDLFGNLIKSVGAAFGIQPKEDQRKNNLRSPQQPSDGYKRQNDQQKGGQHNQSKKHHSEKPGRIRLIPEGLHNQVRSESKPQRTLFEDDDDKDVPSYYFGKK